MDQGVISSLKRRYKTLFLKELRMNVNLSEGVILYFLAVAWNAATSSTLKNAWNKLRIVAPQTSHESTETNDDALLPGLLRRIPGYQSMTSNDIEKWIVRDDLFPPGESCDDDAIVTWIRIGMVPSDVTDNETIEEDDELSQNSPDEYVQHSVHDSLHCVEELCRWSEHGGDITHEDIRFYIIRNKRAFT